MTDTAETGPDQLQVAFPATPTFTRIGRVTVVGLALRLGFDVSTVERLRAAVDTAVAALQGPGRITTRASWTAEQLSIHLDNPEAGVVDPARLADELTELVGRAAVTSTSVELHLATEPT